MDARVTLMQNMTFRGIADSGHEIRMDTGLEGGGEDSAVRPMELVALAMGGCSGMDVISILRKKRQEITHFDVRLHLERAGEYPKIFTSAWIEYEVGGQAVDETAVIRAIQLSTDKYCPVYAMLSEVFPIELRYRILDEAGGLVKEGEMESGLPAMVP